MTAYPDKRRSKSLPCRVLFLNDVSFQYGAGTAQARQVEALLGMGIEVGVLAWASGDISLEQVATQAIDPDLWLGIREVHQLNGRDLPEKQLIAGIVQEVARFAPEVIVVGNIHAAHWPFALLPALRELGCRVLTFVHDAFLFTGRCAYPGSCELYLTGCNETCPTSEQYPKLAPELIAGAWQMRRDIFNPTGGIEVISNSRWSKAMFERAIPQGRRVEPLELGANDKIFRPGDKSEARRALGIPDDKPVVLCAAVNFQEERKGGHLLRAIVEALRDEVTFAAFGHNAQEIPGMLGMGYTLHPDRLALIYQTADVFLSTATEEAFGQTIMEAQLCGIPAIAFHTGGVDEIIRNEITGKLVRNRDVPEAVETLRSFLANARFRKVAGAWAREYSRRRFALWAHQERWEKYLTGRLRQGTGHNPPTLSHPPAQNPSSGSFETYRPSWPGTDSFLNTEHEQIFARTSTLPGWQSPGDSFKLYEMGYHAGDVILEIGTYGGRSATVALRGALANPHRTEPPQFYGVDILDDSITRTRQILADEFLGEYCHLFHGTLSGFLDRWTILPTMVFLDGDHSYEGALSDLTLLSTRLRPGTPVLVHDYLNAENESGKIGVHQAATEWAAGGHGRLMGTFGCCALYVITQSST